MLDIAIGYRSAPRNGAYYLGSTLENHFDVWPGVRPIVSCEPNTPTNQYTKNCDWRVNESVLLNTGNFWRTVELLLQTESEWLCACEDDIEWRSDARYLIQDLLSAPSSLGYGCISPYCSMVNRPHSDYGHGWLRPRNLTNWCGAQALIFHRTHLLNIYAEREAINSLVERNDSGVVIGHCIDYALVYHMVTEMKLPMVAHVPSLVKHTGFTSTTLSNDNRTVLARLEAL